MEYGREILSRGCVFWMALKDHLSCDNKSTVLYSNNNRSSTKSNYIDIKFLLVKERVQSGTYIYRAHWDKLHDCRSTD